MVCFSTSYTLASNKLMFRLISILIIVAASAGAKAMTESILSPCFESKSPLTLRVVVKRKGQRFQVIPPGELDNQTEWFKQRVVRPGATILSKGAQYQEYIEILNIESETVSLRRYGFARGLGKFDEIIKMKISKECINKK